MDKSYYNPILNNTLIDIQQTGEAIVLIFDNGGKFCFDGIKTHFWIIGG